MFDADPTVLEVDYAKWMLDDPRINFAISTRGEATGVDHLGLQTDSDEELAELKARVASAGTPILDEGQTSCCYARSEKHWVTDPQGIAWEHFHTRADIPVFSERQLATEPRAEFCAPEASPGQPGVRPAGQAAHR